MAGRLLVVEDDAAIRAALGQALEDEGYEVLEAPSAEAALPVVLSGPLDALVVDLMLGGMDGFELIRHVRAFTDVPIIIVSARGNTHDIVAGLEAGADDYVTKPFEVKELSARLRALRRRARAVTTVGEHAGEQVVLDVGPPALVLDPASGTLHRGPAEIHLTLTEFRLLVELSRAAGRVLSRQQLLEQVWDRGFFGDERLVDVHVSRLRLKIDSDPRQASLVTTVRGMGYRIDRR